MNKTSICKTVIIKLPCKQVLALKKSCMFPRENVLPEGVQPCKRVSSLDDGREDPNTTKRGACWRARELPFKAFCWRADDGPTLNAAGDLNLYCHETIYTTADNLSNAKPVVQQRHPGD